MRIHFFQHIEYETPANILKWANSRNFSIKGTLLYKNQPFPDFSSFDTLIIMGGPMGVYDEDKYPFLVKEKVFIENAINLGKKVLGICLGAQLIAQVLGANVYKNKYKEIGWFDINITEQGKNSKSLGGFPEKLQVIHWHGDTFDIPSGALWTSKSEGCKNQSFEYNNGQVVGTQFHFEMGLEDLRRLINASLETDLKDTGKYIQTPQEMLSDYKRFVELENHLYKFLDNLFLK